MGTLNQCARKRHINKMAAVGIDPHEAENGNMSDDVDNLPPISCYDIVHYLMNMKSVYTMEELHRNPWMQTISI